MIDDHHCPICAAPFKPDDLCAGDIELGTCHAACLEGSPVVDLDTGEALPDGTIDTYAYSEVTEPSTPAPETHLSGWQPIETAPKDGTRILIWFIHANARFSKDPVAEGWAAAHEAYWIDHNGGGWTWHGLCGVATLWQPLPLPPALAAEGRE